MAMAMAMAMNLSPAGLAPPPPPPPASAAAAAAAAAAESFLFLRRSSFPSAPRRAAGRLKQTKRSPTTLAARSAFSFLPNLFSPPNTRKDREALKAELLETIAPLDRGASASPDDISRVEELAQDLESLNRIKETVKSPLINGKWELLYTTSESVVKKQRPKLLRPSGPIYQAINNDTLRAQNIETWPFFNQVTANLSLITGSRVAVKFDVFKIAGLISIKAPDRARGELEITYLDEEIRISRGDKGNLFILKLVDPEYRVPA